MSTLLQLTQADVAIGGRPVLHGVQLQLARGDRLALIGANGSGKSTLLRTLHGLLPPVRGTFTRDAAARQAMVFQRPFLLRTSVQRNLVLGLWLAGLPWHEAVQRAPAALARVGLQELAGRNARHLSAGQQQRVALARAWCLQPEVLFLDEPTANLDPPSKREVEALMAEFAEGGTTLVFASHNLGQVKRLATRVAYLERGRVLADLPVAEFFDRDRLAEVSPEADLFLRLEH
ncbi:MULTISPECIES: ATP-binding cassette domain-containing protein [Ramlibacter]|uniref:ATP-binding cassette domain-containing protein n=1 Tax=Ramlibacter pinisoli TaxID=2682844 RepID=A0A6N8ITH2_9BURK|nr:MULTISPECIES: ATP-binding cassette domain-containing protein [Ramlibacter]MBA2964227.1 ATP-binding cassette domain-containing protein [Ramlibacter sp. CGMCC 1.13660]MVQ29193.1 ATP-binding cassette domain-containing protein [Ramlibacter pinisoli]